MQSSAIGVKTTAQAIQQARSRGGQMRLLAVGRAEVFSVAGNPLPTSFQGGYLPKMLQRIMGHASITATLHLHGHLYPGEMDRYADRLDGAATDADTAKCGQMKTATRRERWSRAQGFW